MGSNKTIDNPSVIGIDFGTASARAVVVRVSNGKILASETAPYPRWNSGRFQDASRSVFRQHPKDYLDAMTDCVRGAVAALPAEERSRIISIGIDTTGSTVCPVDEAGTPLSMTPEFYQDENAMFYLWKDASASREAEEITKVFSSTPAGILAGETDYCKYTGTYPAERYWSKVLYAARHSEAIKEKAYSWVEMCDWITGVLTGNTRPENMYRSICAAGYKAAWSKEWGGLPSEQVLSKLDPSLAAIRAHFGKTPQVSSVLAGTLKDEWADRCSLPRGIAVAGGCIDAHAGAIGAGITENTVVCTLGTSACDLALIDPKRLNEDRIRALAQYGSMAMDGIVPGYIGFESGQAAFGDLFEWFKRLLLWPVRHSDPDMATPSGAIDPLERYEQRLLIDLERAALALPCGDDEELTPLTLDWFNGRRYPYPDDLARSAMTGLSLGSSAPEIYRSLIFAAVCGMTRILQGMEENGIVIDEVKAIGGVSRKSDYTMQMLADVSGYRISTTDVTETGALGAAIIAAAACGCYPDLSTAALNMHAKESKVFLPGRTGRGFWQKNYQRYLALCRSLEKTPFPAKYE